MKDTAQTSQDSSTQQTPATCTETEALIQSRIARLAEIQDRYDSVDDPWEFHKAAEDRLAALQTGFGPLVGMPCTYHIGSDSYAGEVSAVSPNAHRVKVKLGELREKEFTLRKDGWYRSKGQESGYLTFLKAETSLDPSF